MRNYMKKKQESVELETIIEKEVATTYPTLSRKKLLLGVLGLFVILPVLLLVFAKQELKSVSLGEEAAIQIASAPMAATAGKKGVITIPSGTVKANPFLPYRDLGVALTSSDDVPAYTLVEPPAVVDGNSDAARVMDTIVSGILYDKYSPSAILNIEGNDYLVKKGDVVNNYKVVSIVQDSVTVKLGSNVYKAGIGEILTEGSLNHNEVSNLNNKFGGVQEWVTVI